MPFVSVIIPVYNGADTLAVTIEDILGQTYKDFELIIVDDGSTDSTSAICDQYSADERIRVLHQKNGGPSNARNNGNKIANGKYVLYVDCDDRVEPYCIEMLVNALLASGADIACGGVDRVRADFQLIRSTESRKHIGYNNCILSTKEAISEMLTERKLHIGTWCRLVPREWMLQEPFLEGKIYEDLSSTYRVNLKARKIVVVDNVLYHYVMRGGSITGRKVTTIKQCLDYYEAVNLCADGCKKRFPDLKNDVAVMTARDYLSLYLHINRCPYDDNKLTRIQKTITDWMKKNWKVAANNKKAPKSVRLRIMLFGISPYLYEKLYYIGIRFKGKKIA